MARLAECEFGKNADISVRESLSFPGSTLHGHDFYEIEIITAGKTETTINGIKKKAEMGSVFFLTPTDFHEYSYSGNFGIYNVQFTSDAIQSEILYEITESNIRFFDTLSTCFDEIMAIFSVMKKLNENGKDRRIISKLIECMLMLLINNSTADKTGSTDASLSIQKAIMHVHSHFKDNPTLASVANILHLNPQYFCTKFKAYTGQTYKNYLKSVKLRYARKLVLSTNLPIIEVAENSGYETQSHFNREFKEYYGISPLKMRLSPENK
jgi:AraC-like DNA-binding protein